MYFTLIIKVKYTILTLIIINYNLDIIDNIDSDIR